ncbi:MAG: DNA methyltransferase [Chloroflexia bacterium]
MRTFIKLTNTPSRPIPAEWQDDDVRYPDAIVAYFLQEWTRPGDVVFDLFAGFGTTLIVAEAMERKPVGLEYDHARVEYIRTQLRDPEAITHGDARQLASYGLPQFDLLVTSPPYMQRDDPTDPLAAYGTPGRGYAIYLDDMQAIFAQVAPLMKSGAKVVIEVANLKGANDVTTLAWDIAHAVGAVLHFEGEIVVGWDPHYGYGYDHSYCLVFTG